MDAKIGMKKIIFPVVLIAVLSGTSLWTAATPHPKLSLILGEGSNMARNPARIQASQEKNAELTTGAAPTISSPAAHQLNPSSAAAPQQPEINNNYPQDYNSGAQEYQPDYYSYAAANMMEEERRAMMEAQMHQQQPEQDYIPYEPQPMQN